MRNAAKRRAFDVMQLLLRVTLAVSVALLSGCALLGFGPPTGIVEGTVFYADDGTPIAYRRGVRVRHGHNVRSR